MSFYQLQLILILLCIPSEVIHRKSGPDWGMRKVQTFPSPLIKLWNFKCTKLLTFPDQSNQVFVKKIFCQFNMNNSSLPSRLCLHSFLRKMKSTQDSIRVIKDYYKWDISHVNVMFLLCRFTTKTSIDYLITFTLCDTRITVIKQSNLDNSEELAFQGRT